MPPVIIVDGVRVNLRDARRRGIVERPAAAPASPAPDDHPEPVPNACERAVCDACPGDNGCPRAQDTDTPAEPAADTADDAPARKEPKARGRRRAAAAR